ncbi:hypothetical protein JZU68_05535, partial [bacterium]|nr:hypothetical protein [bacterium]
MKSIKLDWVRVRKVPDLRTSIAKELSNLPRPKITKYANFNFESPELWDKTNEIGVGWKLDFLAEEARIPQPSYDVASTLIPIRSSIQIDFPELWDGINEIGVGWKLDFLTEEARISQPNYDVASTLIPIKSSIQTIDVNPSMLMILHSIGVDIHSRIKSAIKISPALFEELSLDKLSIFGMNYADKHWRKITIPKDDRDPKSKTEKSKEQKRESSFDEPKKRGRKSRIEQPIPSIWDLLFAVLQPPLIFG